MYEPDDFAIDRLFWGSLVFVAIFVVCFFSVIAVRRLLDRRKGDRNAIDHDSAGITRDYWIDHAISRPCDDVNHAPWSGGDAGGFEGMNQREQEMFFSTYAPRKVRKAMRQRQKMRDQPRPQ